MRRGKLHTGSEEGGESRSTLSSYHTDNVMCSETEWNRDDVAEESCESMD